MQILAPVHINSQDCTATATYNSINWWIVEIWIRADQLIIHSNVNSLRIHQATKVSSANGKELCPKTVCFPYSQTNQYFTIFHSERKQKGRKQSSIACYKFLDLRWWV